MKKSKYIFGGLLLIVIGVLWALDTVGVLKVWPILRDWWPLLIIFSSAWGLFTPGSAKALPSIGLAVGSVLLLRTQGIIDRRMAVPLIFAIIVVIVGVYLLLGGVFYKKRHGDVSSANEEISANFTGRNLNYQGIEFQSATYSAVFGSITADLRGAIIAPDAVIHVNAIFGSVYILLPENVPVDFHIVPLFGTSGDKRVNRPKRGDAVLDIDGSVVFGSAKVG